MRVLHLSWEYPPLVYGGLGRHVHALAEAQAALGHDVTVITQRPPGDVAAEEIRSGVRILRVEHDPPHLPFDEEHLLAWTLALQTAVIRRGLAWAPEGRPEVVHAHDWLMAHAGITLREALDTPLVATIHATEAGRHQGWLPSDLSRSIHDVEGWLTRTAARVIACSEHMQWEVERLFGIPGDRIDVIANGIDLGRWRASRAAAARMRARYAGTASPGTASAGTASPDTGPLIVFCGRLEWEKGGHTFIDALPRLRRRFPGLRAVIAGRGGQEQSLRDRVRAKRLGRTVSFAGWLPERDLHALMRAADVLVVPSLYEPFGLVALEGAALGTPLVVAATGGLAEFVIDGETGTVFPAGDPAALAAATTAALLDPDAAARMARRARRRLRREYSWERLAASTVDTYRRARRSRPLTPLPVAPPAPDGNLLRSARVGGAET